MGFLDDPKGDQLREIAEAVARDNFLELFELKTRVQGKKLVVTVVIDKKSGPVSLDECAFVSRDLEKKLDELGWTESPYLLEVTSPGLDRPLRGPGDTHRFQGRLARVLLSEPLEGRMDFRGRLGETQEDRFELLGEAGGAVWLPFSLVKKANLEVEL
jgi:ribosome maturation factor RimP